MSLQSHIALFFTMFVLAFIPSMSVLTVVARSAHSGLSHGIAAILGITCGDIVFIIIAVYGLSFLAETNTTLFVFIKYIGALYLIYLAITLWRAASFSDSTNSINRASLFSSFLAGLLITLADFKAIVFYLGFLPAFMDLSTSDIVQSGMLILTAALAITLAKLPYALVTDKAMLLFKTHKIRILINKTAALILAIVSISLLLSHFISTQ